jgi:cell division protein FtsL
MIKKRNFSLVVLTLEIAAIVVLHAVKMNQTKNQVQELNATITKSKMAAPVVKHFPLLSIK